MSAQRVVAFWVPALPGRALTSNAGAKRNGYAIERAKDALAEAAYYAVLNQLGPDVPHLEPLADVFLDYHICYARRPQDGLYRFTDPSNGGGDVAKPVIDYGVVKTGILGDDNRKFVRFFTCGITDVATLDEEGIAVRITEVTD